MSLASWIHACAEPISSQLLWCCGKNLFFLLLVTSTCLFYFLLHVTAIILVTRNVSRNVDVAILTWPQQCYPTLLDSTSPWITALYKIFQSLKYWRFRVYILPVSSSTTKKSAESSEYCDNYTPLSFEEQTHLSETFLRFIETWINKIRRPAQKKSRVSLVGSCSRK